MKSELAPTAGDRVEIVNIDEDAPPPIIAAIPRIARVTDTPATKGCVTVYIGGRGEIEIPVKYLKVTGRGAHPTPTKTEPGPEPKPKSKNKDKA